MTILEELIEYANNCINDVKKSEYEDYISCQAHKLACQRFLNDVERSSLESCFFYWDEEEAKKIVAEEFLEHEKEELAVVAWRLHQRLGWGEKRICDFLRDFYTDLKQLNDYYQLGGTDTRWLCSQKLKDSGIDWDKIYTSIRGRV